ncbi:hypothetical protein [Pseudoalteromonas sp. McH1-42]|uniref:hypothetical protein n=1 Tax=Pseudoalteromonas sp. McH1-42 TaxID=2917752 RepID=UPI001EF7115A|nr:hypothetical protein [Pseudoalteromonas sp. McH1-42]MCG7564035.1 hypothetical protein [Pseudoalteromonas sp. McH1-42]
MRSWLSAIVISVACHSILLWLLAQQTVVAPARAPQPSIKTYLIVSPPERTQDPRDTEQPSQPPTEPIQASEQQIASVQPVPETKQAESHVISTKTPPTTHTDPQPQVQQTKAHVNKPYKRIDPALGLSRLRQQMLNQPVIRQTPRSNTQPKRLGVPKSHQTLNQPLRQIESKNHIFTEYREGDRCYKEVQGDPNNPPPEGFAKNWLTASSTCDKTAISDAYDAAMGKWLNKKR